MRGLCVTHSHQRVEQLTDWHLVYYGTLQFTASAVLIGIRDKVPMERRETHDLESLCWVIIYLAYKRAIVDTVDTEAGELLKQENDNLFSSPRIPGILRNRAALLVAEQEGMLYHDKPVAEMEVPMDLGIRALVSHWTKIKSERPMAVLLQIIWEFLRSVQPRKTRLNTWDQEMKKLFLRVAKAKRTQGLDQQPSHIQTPSRIVFTVGETVYTDDDFVLTHDGLSEKIQEIQEIAEEYKFDSS
ncbi:hypothetical protein GY45DRAFT_1151535 [Cubamyces sp. BRFM 1775]|nr:hypothetical protein GY45DRAFT_1151535 [Cubamyces sp. BRFM 1775]